MLCRTSPELPEPVIDQENLDQQRRAAEDEDVGAGKPVEHGCRRARKRQPERQHRAQKDGAASKLKR